MILSPDQMKSNSAGAIPKETRSAKESYSSPNWLDDFVSRAIRPSSKSKTMAIKIAKPAFLKEPLIVEMTEKNPKKMLPDVKMLGRR